MKLIFVSALLCCVAGLLRAEDAENYGIVEGDVDKADISVRSVDEVEEQDDEDNDQPVFNARSVEDANEEDAGSDPSVRSLSDVKTDSAKADDSSLDVRKRLNKPGTCPRRSRIVSFIKFKRGRLIYFCGFIRHFRIRSCAVKNGYPCKLGGIPGRCYTLRHVVRRRARCRRIFPRPPGRWFWAWLRVREPKLCCCATRKLG